MRKSLLLLLRNTGTQTVDTVFITTGETSESQIDLFEISNKKLVKMSYLELSVTLISHCFSFTYVVLSFLNILKKETKNK